MSFLSEICLPIQNWILQIRGGKQSSQQTIIEMTGVPPMSQMEFIITTLELEIKTLTAG